MVIKYKFINCYSDAYAVCVTHKCTDFGKLGACLQYGVSYLP
jgi:hypothetical protein